MKPLSDNILTLRAIEPEDADFMFTLDNDTSDWGDGSMTAPLSRHTLREYALTYDQDPFRSGQLRLIAVNRTDGNSVGLIDIVEINGRHRNAKIGIIVNPSARNTGTGSRMLEIASRYCHDILGLESLVAEIMADNTASLKTFGKAGYKECGRIPGWLRSGSVRKEMVIMYLTLA